MAGLKTVPRKTIMPLPLIPIALALAEFAPSLLRYFGVGESSASVVEKVIDVAKSVTGAESPEQALAMLEANTERQYQFKLAILQADSTLEAAYLSDVQSARNRDMVLQAAGNRNRRADTMYLLAVIVIGALVWAVLASEMDEYGKGIITLVLGRFLGYLDNIYNFEFGTTRSSKIKDDTISAMSKEKL